MTRGISPRPLLTLLSDFTAFLKNSLNGHLAVRLPHAMFHDSMLLTVWFQKQWYYSDTFTFLLHKLIKAHAHWRQSLWWLSSEYSPLPFAFRLSISGCTDLNLNVISVRKNSFYIFYRLVIINKEKLASLYYYEWNLETSDTIVLLDNAAMLVAHGRLLWGSIYSFSIVFLWVSAYFCHD